MQAHRSLTAIVVYRKGTTSKVKVVTEVTIKLGPLVVATATGGHALGGRYSQEVALTEYRRNPARFVPGEGAEIARSLGLAT